MRTLVILGLVAGAIWLGVQGFNRIIRPREEKPAGALEELRPTNLPETPALPPHGPPAPPVWSSPVPAAVVVRHEVYVFENRSVPQPPFGLQSALQGNEKNLQMAVDSEVNAWIVRGEPFQVMSMMRIAEQLDVRQSEIDLDFVFFLVSDDYLRSAGLEVVMNQGALYLDSLSVQPGSASLRIGAGEWAVTGELAAQRGSLRVVASPVVRVMTGREFEFSTDVEVPVTSTQRSEGVVTTSFDYRAVGLGVRGSVSRVGENFRLDLNQRNGEVEPDLAREIEAPSFRTQELQTSLLVADGEWSCAGGVKTWRIEKRNRLLGTRYDESQDLLVVFVRPRSGLRVSAAVVPVWRPPAAPVRDLEFRREAHPLLPARGWEDHRNSGRDARAPKAGGVFTSPSQQAMRRRLAE